VNRQVVPLLFAPVLGVCAMIAPVLVHRPQHWYEAPLFPVVRNAVEHVGLPALGFLVVVGLLLGAVSQLQPLKLGAAAILFLPLAAIAEIVADPTSHNLWPLEFVIYGLYGCLVAGGAALSHQVRRWLPRASDVTHGA
jgi:hypothetical protein